MVTKDLSNEEMLALSGAWVNNPATSRLISVHRRTAGLAEDLDAAHLDLVRVRGASRASREELTQVSEEEKAVDALHDRKARGVHLLLSALAELADSIEARDAIVTARDQLFPEGTEFLDQNYPSEAGVARTTRQRLADHPELGELLARLPSLESRTVADEVTGWLAAADQLRQLESQRRHLEQGGAAEAPLDRAAVGRARGRWALVVQALVNQISLDETPDEQLRQLILDPLTEALARAEGRSKSIRPSMPPPSSRPISGRFTRS
jgi:hypothetical protein